MLSGQGDLHLEEIAVHNDLEAALHQIHQTFRNIQAQTAAFGIAAPVSADKSFRQFLSVHLQCIPGDVFDRQEHLFFRLPQVQIDPGPRLSIF